MASGRAGHSGRVLTRDNVLATPSERRIRRQNVGVAGTRQRRGREPLLHVLVDDLLLGARRAQHVAERIVTLMTLVREYLVPRLRREWNNNCERADPCL